MTEPTDAEIIALADETRTAEGGSNGYILPISFARAVLNKWGTPPAVAGEPFCYVSVNKQGDITRTMKRKDKWTNIPLYTTPQPTQPQAGAGALDEARRLFDSGWKAAALFCDREDVVADGIIGFGACPQFEAAFAAAHGIKGGQHGADTRSD